MCCVMPPASVSTTAVSRIASSSDVLPWSTWPMIVTTGGRGGQVVLGVLVDLRLLVLVGDVLDHRPRARTRRRSARPPRPASDCVAVRISFSSFIRYLMICGIGTPSACERSRTVTPDCDGDRTGGRRGRRLLLRDAPPGGRAPRARRAGGRRRPRSRRAACGRSCRRAGGSGGWVCWVRWPCSGVSVEARERRIDGDGLPQDAVEARLRASARSKQASRRQV